MRATTSSLGLKSTIVLPLVVAGLAAVPQAHAKNDSAGALRDALIKHIEKKVKDGLSSTPGAAQTPNAPVASAGTFNPRSEPLEMFGVELGMNALEAAEALKKNAPGMQVQVLSSSIPGIKSPVQTYIVGYRGFTQGGQATASRDLVVILLSAPPSEPKVLEIGRRTFFARGQEVTVETLGAELKKRYGAPQFVDIDGASMVSAFNHSVVLTETEKRTYQAMKLSDQTVARCKIGQNDLNYRARPLDYFLSEMPGNYVGFLSPEYAKYLNPSCGQTVNVKLGLTWCEPRSRIGLLGRDSRPARGRGSDAGDTSTWPRRTSADSA